MESRSHVGLQQGQDGKVAALQLHWAPVGGVVQHSTAVQHQQPMAAVVSLADSALRQDMAPPEYDRVPATAHMSGRSTKAFALQAEAMSGTVAAHAALQQADLCCMLMRFACHRCVSSFRGGLFTVPGSAAQQFCSAARRWPGCRRMAREDGRAAAISDALAPAASASAAARCSLTLGRCGCLYRL